MGLRMADGSFKQVDSGSKMPSSPDRVVFWSSGGWADGCSICRRLASNPDQTSELFSFHRSEVEPIQPTAHDDSIDDALCIEDGNPRKPRKKKASQPQASETRPASA